MVVAVVDIQHGETQLEGSEGASVCNNPDARKRKERLLVKGKECKVKTRDANKRDQGTVK
jgi:hypothetical protein